MNRMVLAAALPLALAACDKAATESDNPAARRSADIRPREAVAEASTAAAGGNPGRIAPVQDLPRGRARQARHRTLARRRSWQQGGRRGGLRLQRALKASGLTWDDATLDRYLESPMKTVPGTKMVYAGLKDPAKRAEVIAYLKTL